VSRDVDGDGDLESVLIGGTALLESNIEARAQVGTLWDFPVIASIFLDGADVVEKADELGKKTPHLAAGVGAGMILGGIKVGLDIGHRMNRKGPNEPHYSPDDWIPNTEFHISIGDAF